MNDRKICNNTLHPITTIETPETKHTNWYIYIYMYIRVCVYTCSGHCNDVYMIEVTRHIEFRWATMCAPTGSPYFRGSIGCATSGSFVLRTQTARLSLLMWVPSP